MISRKKLWVVVEGRSFDVPFYDGVLRQSQSIAQKGYGIQLAELIELNGKAAGGKQHLNSLYRYWRSTHVLRQSNSSGDRLIVCMLDKDHDDILNRKLRSPHVLYTEHADVEAEIFAHGKLSKALRVSLSLTKEEAKDLVRSVGMPLDVLGVRWQEWLTFGCLVAARGIRCAVRPGHHSSINHNRYGNLDPLAYASTLSLIRSHRRYRLQSEQWITGRFNGIRRRGEWQKHVKGKHVPGYLRAAAEAQFTSTRPIGIAGFDERITGVMLATIDFSQRWTRHWLDDLEKL